jgi:hypothetical protein
MYTAKVLVSKVLIITDVGHDSQTTFSSVHVDAVGESALYTLTFVIHHEFVVSNEPCPMHMILWVAVISELKLVPVGVIWERMPKFVSYWS